MEKHRFNLHLPGLLKVLAEHLYSSKKVAIRELIQNAHDSCVRRKIEGGESDYRSRIDLDLDPVQRTLTIRDNGAGLTSEEIGTYLATIGRGYTRELREKLTLYSASEAAELIGQFGLGFLSAFLIAAEVTLTTRSFQGGQASRWHSVGDEHYELTPGWREEVGTSVELRVKPAASFLLREKELSETVRCYADFVPTPIYLQGDAYPLNRQAPPWEDDHADVAIREYIGRAFPGTEPLYVLQLRDWQVRLADGTLTVPLQGFLFVPPGSIASVREYGDLTVYIRRMFICDRERDLLPPWARFVRGVIDCPVLQPTASREGIHQDENFESVQQALEEQLGQDLRRLAQHDAPTWRLLVRGHSDVITGWAVKDNEFFERVEDLVVFRTTRGLLNLPDYLKQSGGNLYYVTRELGSLQEQLLAEGRDVPAIDASWFAVTPFLEKYTARHAEVGLVKLDGEAHTLLRSVPEGPFAGLLEHYRSQQLRARVAAFKPLDVPALILYPQGAEIVREARQSLDEGEMPGGLAGLISDYVERKSADAGDFQGTLYLNASCPLVRRLAEDAALGRDRAMVLAILYQTARLFAGRMLAPLEAVGAFREINQALERMMPP
jgi:molecular chaperone HtpG